jgi:RNA polymerase primary sigma factor
MKPIHEADHSLKLYLKEISKTPLLTVEEEAQLAARIKKGGSDGQKAKEHMILANLRLVVKIANDYSGYGLPLTDLISEGNIGLTKAVERFDPKKGGKLSTYGAWWIKQSIKRALANQSKTIRLPVHMVDKIAKIRRIETMLASVLQREPTDEELAEELGLPRKKIAMLKQAARRLTSLDAPINDGEDTRFGEIIADEAADNPFEVLAHNADLGRIDEILAVLDPRERCIIDERFGLNGRKERTLEEVGREFGVTRERIRQLQNTALTKMRKASKKMTTESGARLPEGMTEDDLAEAKISLAKSQRLQEKGYKLNGTNISPSLNNSNGNSAKPNPKPTPKPAKKVEPQSITTTASASPKNNAAIKPRKIVSQNTPELEAVVSLVGAFSERVYAKLTLGMSDLQLKIIDNKCGRGGGQKPQEDSQLATKFNESTRFIKVLINNAMGTMADNAQRQLSNSTTTPNEKESISEFLKLWEPA